MAEIDKRLRYYDGQFLQEQDFTDEQQYHLDRQRRHNRLLHSYGIAVGLAVTAEIGASSVTVHPGTAIDKDGRTIVLTELRNVALEDADSQPLLVVIAYGEEPSDPARVGDAGNTRWLERPEVKVIAEDDAPAEGTHIRLARLHLDNGTVSQNDKTVRRSAGKLGVGTLEVENPLGAAAQSIQDQNGKESSLAIGTESVEIKTNVDRRHVLTVSGNVAAAPLVELRSKKNESSIRYVPEEGGVPWHAGAGGYAGENFFFWTQKDRKIVATISPEGALNVNGRVNGRDVAADGLTLDALASATLEGVSNPGGNIDLIGQRGITVTGNNDVNTITIANAPGSLVVQAGIKDEPKVVQDQMGISSSLKIGKNNVEVSAGDERHVVLKVSGKATNGPVEELHSTGNESSIRYSVAEGGVPWHVGAGGWGGAKNFFFWNESNGVIAKITPEGNLVANSFATPDGRDIKTDRDTLDALASATLEGVSNPGGNIDFIGQNGITVAGNNEFNTITIANAPGSLVVQEGIKDGPGVVQDQMGAPSSLAIGTKKVSVSADVNDIVLNVTANVVDRPLMELRSTKNEASIRYATGEEPGTPWHLGTGGSGGAGNFFFWNQKRGVVSKMTPEGALSVKGLNVDTSAEGMPLTVSGNSGTAPLVEMKSQSNESSIRYVNSDGVAWHVGSGGNGDPGNFFFWNSQKHVVATVKTEGTLSLNGGLEVKKTPSAAPDQSNLRNLMIDSANGQVYNAPYLQRAVIRTSFTQADPNPATRTISAGFLPKFISMEGRVHAKLGAGGNIPYGGAMGGFCRCFENRSFYAVGHGPHIFLLPYAPYVNFYNHMHEGSGNALGNASFHDWSQPQTLHVHFELVIEAIIADGFTLKLMRITDEGRKQPAEFGLDLAFAFLG